MCWVSEANKKYLADIFEKASLLELAFWKMAYRNERMEENAKRKKYCPLPDQIAAEVQVFRLI